MRYFTLSGAPLLEIRRTQGHRTWVYGGPSFQVAKGVYTRSGMFRSHYVPGVEELEEVDIGAAHITDRRAVFVGGKQTREFPFAKLIGYGHHPEGQYTQFSVQGREHPSCIRYGDKRDDWCFRLDLAHAQFSGQRDAFTASLRQELADHAEAKPPAAG